MVGKMAERVGKRRKERKCLRGKRGGEAVDQSGGWHIMKRIGVPPSVHVRNQTMFSAGHIVFLIRKVLIYLRCLTLTSKGEISRCFSPAHFVTARGKAGNRCKLANRSAPSLRPQAISRSLIAELPRGPRGTRAEVFLMTLRQGTDWTSRLIRLNTRDTPPSWLLQTAATCTNSLHLLPIIQWLPADLVMEICS